jgi:hypothetical protein
MLFVAIVNTSYNWKMTVYYESEWSFIGSTVSLFCILMSHRSQWWHHAATYTSEFAICFNFVVSVILWGAIFTGLFDKNATKFIPTVLEDLKHLRSTSIDEARSPIGPNEPKFMRFTHSMEWVLFEQTFVHIWPMTNSIISLVVTDQIFFKKDAIYLFFCGLVYIPINYWGTMTDKQPVYDIQLAGLFDWTWKNPFQTFYTYFL